MKNSIRLALFSVFVLFASSLYAASLFGFGGPDKDAYNKSDTEQYKNLTAKLIGKWNIVSMRGDADKELLGTRYSAGTLTLDENTRNARLVLSLTPEEIAAYLPDWREKNGDPKLVISEYIMITESPFTMIWDNANEIGRADRVYLTLSDPKFIIEVKGEGDLEAFKQKEFIKYSAAKKAASSAAQAGATAVGGGLGGKFGAFLAQTAAKQVTDTQFGKIEYFYVVDTSGAGNIPKFKDDNSGNWTWFNFTLKSEK